MATKNKDMPAHTIRPSVNHACGKRIKREEMAEWRWMDEPPKPTIPGARVIVGRRSK